MSVTFLAACDVRRRDSLNHPAPEPMLLRLFDDDDLAIALVRCMTPRARCMLRCAGCGGRRAACSATRWPRPPSLIHLALAIARCRLRSARELAPSKSPFTRANKLRTHATSVNPASNFMLRQYQM